MKILLTGGTGFLGKEVLQRLVADSRISQIDVVSRRKKTYPDSKVRLVSLDLSQPDQMRDFETDADAVIHLAGLYDFKKSAAENYVSNVLATSLLVKRIKDRPFFFSSTYAVGNGSSQVLDEKPLSFLPEKKLSYSYCKAMAEDVVLKSGLPGAVFRLGILVGNSNDGRIEKIDGPYYLLKFVYDLHRSPLLKKIPALPIFAQKGVLPLVPVDCAAKVFVEALFKPELQNGPAKIFGVYRSEGTSTEDLAYKMIHKFLPQVKTYPIRKMPRILLKIQEKITRMPGMVFEYSLNPVKLENSHFEETFSDCLIPGFESYEKVFFDGFNDYVGGSTS